MQRLESEGKEVRFFIVGKKIQWKFIRWENEMMLPDFE
jgi:hypothetical protein